MVLLRRRIGRAEDHGCSWFLAVMMIGRRARSRAMMSCCCCALGGTAASSVVARAGPGCILFNDTPNCSSSLRPPDKWRGGPGAGRRRKMYQYHTSSWSAPSNKQQDCVSHACRSTCSASLLRLVLQTEYRSACLLLVHQESRRT